MIRFTIRMTALLAALLSVALAPLPAAAQNAVPALRASVIVSSDVVRIGDLVENSGPVADIPIFRSPDLGTSGAVATDRVVEAIRPHHLIDIDTRGVSAVTVTRLSRAIGVEEISARVAKTLAAQYALGDSRDVTVYFDHEVRALEVEPDAAGDLQVTGIAYDPRTTRFDVTLDLPSSPTLHRHPVRYSGTALETVAAIGVDHTVEHGEVLKESDLVVLRRPKSETGSIAEMAQVAGLAARHQLHPGQPLRSTDLTKPEIVQRGESVTIVYEAPGIVLTLRGQAQDGGALGDTIGVLNTQSKRVVQGTITAPGRVTVSVAATRVVDNGAVSAAGVQGSSE
jgi:flagellar basal body P-ring formation protein FlgA